MLENRTLEARNLKFAIDENVPKYWLGGRAAISTFWNNLSTFFPLGERFFIGSVKAHVPEIDDPKLLAEMRAFYAQEGFHSREHGRYNKMLERHGYDVADMERRTDALLRLVRKLPDRTQLAVTASLEHLTALLAHLVLETDMMKDAHPAMAQLWRWHAAEEAEHKAVAFDVYERVGGHYTERVTVMFFASLIFFAKVAEQQVRMMAKDGTLWSAPEWLSLLRYLWVEPGGFASALPLYLDFFKPGFHPWDHDNQDLLEEWQAQLEQSDDYEAVA